MQFDVKKSHIFLHIPFFIVPLQRLVFFAMALWHFFDIMIPQIKKRLFAFGIIAFKSYSLDFYSVYLSCCCRSV